MKKIRYFIDFMDRQQAWLNEMAEKGYRLCGTTRLGYEFSDCTPGSYTYVVQYVAEKSLAQLNQYRAYLEEMGYVYYGKNINMQFGFKAKLRYTGKRLQLATNPGLLNQELLIIEVPKGEQLEVFTTAKECYEYYQMLRNVFLGATVFLLLMACLGRTKVELFGHVYVDEQFFILQALVLVLCIPCLVIAIRMAKRTRKWKKEMQIRE